MLTLKRGADMRLHEISLHGGAVVRVRRATALDYNAAVAAVARINAGIRSGEEALDEAGLDNPEMLQDPAIRAGLNDYLLSVALAERCIQSWEGIGDENGQPIEPDRGTIQTLLRDPDIGRKLTDAILQPLHEVVAEGKECAALLDGVGVAAENIAPVAVN